MLRQGYIFRCKSLGSPMGTKVMCGNEFENDCSLDCDCE